MLFFAPSDIIQYNKFAYLHNGTDIFFCKTDFLPHLFDSLRNYQTPSILISGNSDIPLTDELALLAPSCIKKWFAPAVMTDNPLVVPMPYGVDNHQDCVISGHGKGWKNTAKKILLLCTPHPTTPEKDLYVNFSLQTHPDRKAVYQICKELSYATMEISTSHVHINSKPLEEYVKNILEHKMVVCPRGNAPAETHRFWETLYLNRVPIVKKEKGVLPFLDLPVIALDDWQQLSDREYIFSEYEKVKNNPKDMLLVDYWLDKINEEALKIR